ncbi:MAG: hypothetical protein K2O01_07470, partial [Bacteroidales bacterium]|nr:hypothetical protein [Bacteroidales bacterium]
AIYESPEQFRTFNAFAADLAQRGIKVYRFIYWPTAGPQQTADGAGSKTAALMPPVATDESQRLFVITPQDLAFNRCPKAVCRQHLAAATEKSFHLLFDTSERFHYLDAYMASLLPARFKIGFAKDMPLKQQPYDLTLKPAEGGDLRGRLDLLLCYLNVFDKS